MNFYRKALFEGLLCAGLIGVAIIPTSGQMAQGASLPETPSAVGQTEAAATAADAAASVPATDAVIDMAKLDDETVCLAKIVHHEAGNQSLKGQVAVAQVVINRVAAPQFPKSICAVGMQRGQFFNVMAYQPKHDDRWETAVKVALDVQSDKSEPVVGKALYFHSAHARSSAIAKSRQYVTRIQDHVFYR